MSEQIKIVINSKWLEKLQKAINPNLSGIPKIEEIKTIKHLTPTSRNRSTSLFSSINTMSTKNKSNTFRLKGALGDLLGDIERFELAITIEGDQGGGKTRFTYQLADAFAELGH